MKNFVERLAALREVSVFTGAGVSTLCGIPDFRGPQGLYQNADAERIFDVAWFKRDPSIYYRGCRALVYGTRQIAPGPVHQAIVKLEQAGVVNAVITQNIDMLHQKAGSRVVHEIHGSPQPHYCFTCGREKPFEAICEMLQTVTVPRCEVCGGVYKPSITFFGEMPPQEAFGAAVNVARQTRLMLVLGSSLTVHPAASLPGLTIQSGGEIAIINAQSTPLDHLATFRFHDLADFATHSLSA